MEIRRVGKFGVVGLLNTLIDFVVFNAGHFQLHLGLIPANLISTSVAMIFSFYANRRIVFRASSGRVWRQLGLFWLATAFGVYVLQNAAIWILTHPLMALSQSGVQLVQAVGLHHLSQGFILANLVKVAATILSLIWNYLAYREVVFA